jgi:hypothetical protein
MCQTNTGDIFKVIGKGGSFVGEKVCRCLNDAMVRIQRLSLSEIFSFRENSEQANTIRKLGV